MQIRSHQSYVREGCRSRLVPARRVQGVVGVGRSGGLVSWKRDVRTGRVGVGREG